MSADPKRVFVIHGRNLAARTALSTFLRAIKLDPVEWGEAVALTGKGSPYPGEVLDAAFAATQAAVALLTGDDVARLRPELLSEDDQAHERDLTPQARPNVLFEAGMAFARYPDRTILVELGRLRPFSDVLGRHTVRMNDSPERRKELADRLKTAGCDVQLTGNDWLRHGEFGKAVIPSGRGDHRLAVGEAERAQALKEGYGDAVRIGYVSPSPGDRLVPLYSLWSEARFDHHYTTDANERDLDIHRLGYSDNGVCCYVYNTHVPDTVPLYRLWQVDYDDHLFTTDVIEKDNAERKHGYRQEGTAPCYVFESPSPNRVPIYGLFKAG